MPQDHPVFHEPTNRSVKIWRYMDFAKFFAMLEDQALFFARADRLGDPFEGSYPQRNLLLRPDWYKPIIEAYGEGGVPARWCPGGESMPFLEFTSHLHRWLCQWTFVNCWHISDYESAAMWRLYCSTYQAVAVQTTYEQLRSSLASPILTGEVEYGDDSIGVIPEDNLLRPLVHKRASFSFERELRAVMQELPLADGHLAIGQDNAEVGRLVSVDLHALVERVYVGPGAPPWYADLVRRVVTRFGYQWPVETSGLDARPLY